MSFISLFLTAFGLSMDAFAVSVANGMCTKQYKIKYAIKFGLYFGFFQAFMPILGWAAGISFSSYIESIDHWISFILLGFIGGKMIAEGLKGKDDSCEVENSDIDSKSLLILAVATSIDALAVGVSFAFLRISIISCAIIIGLVTFCISTAGVYLGKKFGNLFENKAEILGGIILIAIGAKILIQHLELIKI